MEHSSSFERLTAHLKPLSTVVLWCRYLRGVLGELLIGDTWCREPAVSRTAVQCVYLIRVAVQDGVALCWVNTSVAGTRAHWSANTARHWLPQSPRIIDQPITRRRIRPRPAHFDRGDQSARACGFEFWPIKYAFKDCVAGIGYRKSRSQLEHIQVKPQDLTSSLYPQIARVTLICWSR